MKRTKFVAREDNVCSDEDREAYLKENAVSIIKQRDRLINRLREQVTFLTNRMKCYKKRLEEKSCQ